MGYKIKFANNCFFINDNNILYRFSSTGKFLNKLANHGRGPFEFMQIMSFDINTKTNELYLYDNVLGKIEVFDTALIPIRTLRSVPRNMHDILIDKHGNIVCSIIRNDYRAQGRMQNSLIVLDAKGGCEIFNRESKILSIKPKEKSNFIFSTEITKYRDCIYYKERRSDSYYSLQDSSDEDSVAYRINVGATYPAELDYDWVRHDEINNYPRLGGAVETFRYIFVYFRPKNEDFRLAFYDKQEKKTIVLPPKGYPQNDIDYGHNPRCCSKLDDKTLIEIIPAMKFKDMYKDNQKFYVVEEDNPILMFIHLESV